MYLTDYSHLPSISFFRQAEKRSPIKNFDLISQSFDEILLRRIKTLIFNSDPPSISLSWLSLAVDLLSSTHAEAKTLITDLKLSGLDKSLASYLDDSVKLLDICNSITSELEQLRHRRLLIKFVQNLLGDGSQVPAPEKLHRARNSFSDAVNSSSGFTKRRLQNPAVLIRDLAVGLGNPPRGKISTVGMLVHRTIYAVSAVTVFVAGVVVAVLTGSPETIHVRVPNEFLWSDSFNSLELKITGEIRKRFTGDERRFSDEVEAVEARVTSVCEIIDDVVGRDGVKETRLGNAVKELGTVIEAFSDGLERLCNGVNGFFDAVLCTRNGLLENVRVSSEKPRK